MFGKRSDEPTHTYDDRSTHSHDRTPAYRGDAPAARGGVSFGPIITGVLVAFGAMFLFSAIVAGVLASMGILDNVVEGEALQAGLGAGIALVVAQFLAYLWGGYTAGRMSRGAGLVNGLLVPLVAILVAAGVGAIATMLGAETRLGLPNATSRLPLENDLVVEWGAAIGIASLVAMFLGGILGGTLGARWHTKLERRTWEEEREARDRDARDHDRHDHGTPAPTTTAGATTAGATGAATTTTATPPPPAGSYGDRSEVRTDHRYSTPPETTPTDTTARNSTIDLTERDTTHRRS